MKRKNHREGKVPSREAAFGRASLQRGSPILRPRGQRASRHLPSLPATRKRGAQIGNQNARTHGFYSHLFKQKERKLLDELPVTDLSPEIELIHVSTTRFLEALEASKGTLDYEGSLTALRLVNLSAQSIATLLRVQVLTGSLSRDAAEVLKALDEQAANAKSADEPDPDAWGLVPSD